MAGGRWGCDVDQTRRMCKLFGSFQGRTKEQEPRYQIVELGFSASQNGFSPTHSKCSTYRRREKACFWPRLDHIACFPLVVYTSSVLVAAANIWLIWSLGFNIQRYPCDQQQRASCHPKHQSFTYNTCTKMLRWKYLTLKSSKTVQLYNSA